jgi:hypothetical protein
MSKPFCLLLDGLLLAWLTPRSWSWRHYVPPKRRQTPTDCMASHSRSIFWLDHSMLKCEFNSFILRLPAFQVRLSFVVSWRIDSSDQMQSTRNMEEYFQQWTGKYGPSRSGIFPIWNEKGMWYNLSQVWHWDTVLTSTACLKQIHLAQLSPPNVAVECVDICFLFGRSRFKHRHGEEVLPRKCR